MASPALRMKTSKPIVTSERDAVLVVVATGHPAVRDGATSRGIGDLHEVELVGPAYQLSKRRHPPSPVGSDGPAP
jgi:hypothetical protein